jgi:anion-transporting  ArsA/GET3 family ATPase
MCATLGGDEATTLSRISYPGDVVAPARTAAATVPGIPTDARLHVVSGKGGTGKTTVASALAVALAEGGKRTLLVEVEGRQALAQLFDVPALPYEERHLATAPGNGEVLGLAVDPELALLEYLEMFYNLKRAARVLKRMGAIDFATTLAPGVRDVLLTGKVKEATTRTDKSGRFAYDAVVLDAPPTGRIRQFLDATTEVANLTKAGPINRQSVGVLELLHSRRTAIHLVTLLEEMPVQETIDAAAELTANGFHLGAVVVNRARPTLVADGQVSADGHVDVAELRHGLSAAGVDESQADALAGQLAEYADRQAVQAENRARLAAVTAPRIELPDLTPPVDLGELIELAGYFLEPS